MVQRRVQLTPRSHTLFEERFPGKRRRLDEDLPPIALWRNNLVGLELILLMSLRERGQRSSAIGVLGRA